MHDQHVGFLIKLGRHATNKSLLRALSRSASITPHEQQICLQVSDDPDVEYGGVFVEACKSHRLENISIHYMSSFINIHGQTLHTGQELHRGAHLLMNSAQELSLITNVEERHTSICTECKRYFFQQCRYCLTKDSFRYPHEEDDGDLVDVGQISIAEDENWLKLQRPHPLDESRFTVRYTYDLETVTSSFDQLFRPITVCIQIDKFLFSPYQGRVPVDGRSSGNQLALHKVLDDKIKEIMVARGFTRAFQGQFGIDTLDNETLQFYINLTPNHPGITNGLIVKAIVHSQNDIYSYMTTDQEFKMHLGEVLSTFDPEVVIPECVLMSSAYNGAKFDDLFLLPYRLYSEPVLPRYTYGVKNGGVMRMTKRHSIKIKGGRTCRVMFQLFDGLRFWGAALRKVGHDLKLPIQKGDMDFNRLNAVYYGSNDDDPDFNYEHVSENFVHSMGPFKDDVDAWESVKKFQEPDGSFNMSRLVLEYCMRDVIVTNLCAESMQSSMSSISVDMVGFHLNTYKRVGIPACSKSLMLSFVARKDIDVYTPQDAFYELINSCKYGGRSEIMALGLVEDDVILLDINSMYSNVMTGPLPFGKGQSADQSIIDHFHEFFDRCNVEGWRKDINEVFTKRSTDIGFLFAYCDVIAPKDRRLLRNCCPVPYRSKQGLCWSNESRYAQPLCSIDMETMARNGFKVRVVARSNAVYFPMSFFDIADIVKEYANRRKNTSDDSMKNVLKLLSNALYGKFLENLYTESLEIVADGYDSAFTQNIPTIDEFCQEVSSKKWKREAGLPEVNIKLICPVKNPYVNDDEEFECEEATREGINIARYTGGKKTTNRTPAQWGVVVLAASRTMIWDTLMLSEPDSDKEVETEFKELGYYAAETDSLHMNLTRALRLPEWFINGSEVGSWNHDKKFYDYYMKVETFDDKSEVKVKKAIFLSKKFYYLFHNDGGKDKFACKGMSKADINAVVMKNVLEGAYFSHEDCRIVFTRDLECISSNRFARKIPGVRSNHKDDFAIKQVCLSRRIMPSFSCKRPLNPGHDVDLAKGYLKLLPFDDTFPNTSVRLEDFIRVIEQPTYGNRDQTGEEHLAEETLLRDPCYHFIPYY